MCGNLLSSLIHNRVDALWGITTLQNTVTLQGGSYHTRVPNANPVQRLTFRINSILRITNTLI